MRSLILTLAAVATIVVPALLAIAFPPWWLAAICVMAASHAFILWPTLRPNSQWLGPVITSFDAVGKQVWLTIDDGPTDDTSSLVDALAERGVVATFFLKGSLVAEHPERVRLILAGGHTVANHSQTHPSGSFWCLPPAALRAQIDGCSTALENCIGKKPELFRAPVGMKNPFVHPILAKRSMPLIGWTVRGFDSFGENVERVAGRIVPRVLPGAIIVMHQGRSFSVACICRVVDELRAAGYSFVIPALTRLKTKR